MWTVRDPAAPTPAAADWSAGDLDQLVSVIRLTPAQLGDPDSVAAALSNRLDGAVARLSESQKRELAQALDLPESARSVRGNALDTAAQAGLAGHRHRRHVPCAAGQPSPQAATRIRQQDCTTAALPGRRGGRVSGNLRCPRRRCADAAAADERLLCSPRAGRCRHRYAGIGWGNGGHDSPELGRGAISNG